MFDQFKQLMQLKNLQDSLKKEKVMIEKEGIKVTMNGNFLIEEIIINPALNKEQQEKILKDCLNEAVQKIQVSMAHKVSGLV